MDYIEVRGAREHNLKNVYVKIPKHQLVVFTGVSGSGKSSLAFNTVHNEGQRRYIESLSTYARQFLSQNSKPDVDQILGLSPSIAIEQKSTSNNPRSTVGTLTEIYDYARLLYARIGIPHCPKCGQRIHAATVQEIVDCILRMEQGMRILLLAPMIVGKKGSFHKEFTQWRALGFVRARVDGEVLALKDGIVLDKRKKHNIELVIDRLQLQTDMQRRLTESVELALRTTGGKLIVAALNGQETLFSEHFACITCGTSIDVLEPRLFSFNSPQGACSKCDGLGISYAFDPACLLANPEKPILSGGLREYIGRFALYPTSLTELLLGLPVPLGSTWNQLTANEQHVILYGTAVVPQFLGLIGLLEERYKKMGMRLRAVLDSWRSQKICKACQGQRLRPESLSVTCGGLSIAQLSALNIQGARKFLADLNYSPEHAKIAQPIFKEIDSRLCFLANVGLDYISLNRTAGTLSGGELQRIRLATQIGSALEGVIYVLDEPSIGLHQRDNDRLLATLKQLRDVGNTVLVVEHDEDTIRAADWVIDLGPGAGMHGGEILASCLPAALSKVPQSLTGRYLSGQRMIQIPEKRRQLDQSLQIVLEKANRNNLRDIDVTIPLQVFVCVTGVSGSGKSTLINDTLITSLKTNTNQGCRRISGYQQLEQVIEIDQSPIGRTPRSNPATYTQIFGLLREVFALVPESRSRGYTVGRFSFNVKGGRCEACQGDGVKRVEMHFLPDVFVTCEVCQGLRYNRDTLEILYRGKTIADILAMTVEEALLFFSAQPQVARRLQTLVDVGLGYIHLGQAATTLSGGEAQRIKLAKELSRRSTAGTLYVLDEPTTGLHFYDVEKLLLVLHQLVDQGSSVVVIEHNLDVIKTADYVIDLGPEGGEGGGMVVATGSPEKIAAHSQSHTGRFLKPLLRQARPL